MKRSKPTRQQIAKQLIAQHKKEQEVLQLHQKIEEAKAQEATRPRIGPKEPKILPYKENNMYY